MIRPIFLLAISLLLSAKEQCFEHYNPSWFEEPSDELVEFIEEHFESKKISFLPTLRDINDSKLIASIDNSYQLPNSTLSYNKLEFPNSIGMWRYSMEKGGVTTTHIVVKEPIKVEEIDAINLYNGLLGDYWNNYSVDGYKMVLEPEDTRVRYKDIYFELNIVIYGIKNDASPLKTTFSDVIFRDYTNEVNRYIKCKSRRSR